ncbi:MAG: phage tail tape measure protein, partial [Bacteroidales bacterium]|nr:phage tail tape measure protein [Bacteroidales bacterium]
VYGVWKAFKDGLTTLKEIDDTLVGIRKVAEMTAAEANALARAASEVVGEYGRTVQDFLSAYETFARAGFRGQALNELSELSLLLQNVGDVTAEMANQTIVATNAGFKFEGNINSLTHAIDAMNEVSNNNATTVEKMSDAVRMSANVADTAGFSFDEFISIIGTATAVTQREGSEIGRAIRTIVANIRQINDAEAEVDEETWGKAGKSLNEVANISTTMNGELRDTMDVLTELAGKWGTLNTVQRQQLANDLANKRQMDVFLAIMDNWTMVEKQMTEAVGSTGSAIQENETYLDSMSAKVDEFRVNVTKMWQDTIDTDFAKDFVSMGSGLINLINDFGLANLALTLGVMSATKQTGVLHKAWVSLKKPLGNLKDALLGAASAFLDAKKENIGFSKSLKAGVTHIKGNAAAWSALGSIVATVAVIAITQFIQASKKANRELEQIAETAISSANSYRELKNEIDSLAAEYGALSQTKNRTIDEDNRLAEVADLLKTKYEESAEAINLVKGEQEKLPEFIDTTTGAFENNTTAVEENIEALRLLSVEQANQLIIANQTAVQTAEAFFSGFDDYAIYLDPITAFTNEIIKKASRASNILYGINTPEARTRGNDFKTILEDINKELQLNLETNHLSKKELKDLEAAQKLLSEEIEKNNKIIEENIRLKALSGTTELVSEAEIRRVSAMENRMEGLNRATAHASSATEDLAEDLAA